MPVGGGSIGMNVWVENGDLLFYVNRSGHFDENNTLLKVGRFRQKGCARPFWFSCQRVSSPWSG